MGPLLTVLFVFVGLMPMQHGPQPMLFQTAVMPYEIELIGVETEQETGERFLIEIRLGGPIDIDVGDILRPDPVEIRPLEGQGAPIRPTFRRAEGSVFDAEVTFDRQGLWELVLYPDIPEALRPELPSDPPTNLTLTVTNPPAGWVGPALLAVLAAGLFAVALGGRKRQGPPKKKLPPTTGGDTWWTGG